MDCILSIYAYPSCTAKCVIRNVLLCEIERFYRTIEDRVLTCPLQRVEVELEAYVILSPQVVPTFQQTNTIRQPGITKRLTVGRAVSVAVFWPNKETTAEKADRCATFSFDWLIAETT